MSFHNLSSKILFLGEEGSIFLDSRLGCIYLKKDRKRSDRDHTRSSKTLGKSKKVGFGYPKSRIFHSDTQKFA